MEQTVQALVVIAGAQLAVTAWLAFSLWRARQLGLALVAAARRKR